MAVTSIPNVPSAGIDPVAGRVVRTARETGGRIFFGSDSRHMRNCTGHDGTGYPEPAQYQCSGTKTGQVADEAVKKSGKLNVHR
jgi:hypothetical protein